MSQVNKDQLREKIDATMDGERERIKQVDAVFCLALGFSRWQALRSKLVQSGWRDEIKSYVADLIEARGVDNVSAEDLIDEVLPRARERVSEEVKNALLSMIRDAMSAGVKG
jgi:hypothetical protein